MDKTKLKKLFIVTGGYGHLGNTIIKELASHGEKTRALVLPADKASSLDGLGIEIFPGDVRRIESLEPLFIVPEQTDIYVIHTAGIVTIASKFHQNVYDVNVTGTANILSLCKKYNVKKLIHVSSVHAIPEKPDGQIITETDHFNPEDVTGLYAQTKAEATQKVLDSVHDGLNAVIVHPSGIIGPGDFGHGHLTQLIMDYLDGRLTACIDGGYDFVDVRDVAAGILAAIDKGRTGACYILSGHTLSVEDLLEKIHEISGKKKIHTKLPAWFAQLTAPLAEFYYSILKQPPLYTRYSLYTLSSNSNFSHKKATAELGYYPRPIEQTLKDTVLWLIQNGRLKKFKM